MEEFDASDIIKILVAASELSIQDLIPYIQSFLIENKVNWIEQNFSMVYQTSFENNSFLKLQKFCTELISKGPDKIFKSLDFNSISEKSLISLIQHDNLQMRDVQVWEYVLKWGLAQNPGLPSNPKSLSNDDSNALKNTLQKCIPFIKFYNLTSDEFYSNVFPYKKILPKELREDLMDHFLNPSSKQKETANTQKIEEIKVTNSTNINSKIITFQRVELISKWIDRLEITDKKKNSYKFNLMFRTLEDITDKIKNSYKFDLIFRASRDGFSPDKFHEICDNISHTITIVKVKNSDEILGGYNPIVWKSDCDKKTKDSFIFSFENKDNVANHILSRVTFESHAIYYATHCGPSFGYGDLVCFERYCYCEKHAYEKPIRKFDEKSLVEEYEVFQIINN